MIFRCTNFVLTHLTWAYAIYIHCLYFQFWKSYDILWIWIHLVLCICLPPLRSDNIFLMACSLIVQKVKNPSKTAKQLFKEQWAKEEKAEINAAEETERPQPPAQKSNRLASAVSLALFLLRLRVSLAVLLGNLNHKLLLPIEIRAKTTLYKMFGPLSDLFIVFLWVDASLLWVMAVWAVCRQCRLCCILGCCRFYLWVLGLIAIGAVIMELPMYYVFTKLDVTWCNWDTRFQRQKWVINQTTTTVATKGVGGGF